MENSAQDSVSPQAPAALPPAETSHQNCAEGSGTEKPAGVLGSADSSWRGEISARLSRYRARRKMRPPRYPSLKLQFDAAESPGDGGAARSAAFEPASHQALALDPVITDGRMAKSPAADTDAQFSPEPSSKAAQQAVSSSSKGFSAKILKFPRFNWAEPAPALDQLAEPVVTRPRILEVPEVTPPPPALGGITIEASEPKESVKQPGIDIPLQGVSLARRIFASAIDSLIVVVASALFAVIFWKVAAVRPPRLQILGLAAGIPCLLWAACQYLLIVYGASTPGLRAAGLEIVRFDGGATTRSLRRWRVLASYLSAASLGMGYAWVLLDEDALCWHDRITHTYLARRRRTTEKTADCHGE